MCRVRGLLRDIVLAPTGFHPSMDSNGRSVGLCCNGSEKK